MIHHFPLFATANSLSRHDFHYFSQPFSRKIKEKIITAGEVHFIEDALQLEGAADDLSRRCHLQELFTQTISTNIPAAYDDCLLFPFSVHDEQVLVALVSGIDRLLVKKAGLDWLQETRDCLQREFLTVKLAGVDLQTGLLNSAHLHSLFDSFPETESVGLVLVEIYPRVRTAMEAMQHVRRAAAVLKSFIGKQVPLYHIGQSVFAFSWQNCNEDSVARFGPMLVSFLKQEQFKRVHVGYSQGPIGQCRQIDTRKILDESWLALQVACKRGPFSFCTYRSLQHFQRHSLYTSVKGILTRIHPYWQNLDQFALVQLHAEHAAVNIYDKITLNLADSKKIKGLDNDVYIVLPNTELDTVLPLVTDMLLTLDRDQKTKSPVAAGIALFPYGDFRKSELVLNCRKALLHGALLGKKGMITVFDALSLNVSGDIFYGEGDIPRAVKDYRRGLLLQPHDVNLLNSLGVSYAMMNKHRLANDCFLKALTVKNDDFMSWYNLGLGRELQGDISGAVESFEQARKCPLDHEQDTTEARKELPLQLGKLYCQTGRYQETLAILLPWYDKKNSDPRAGRALRYLGESFHGIGRDRDAMIWLQRAIRFDEFDASALSLLGEVYLENNEGDQIALNLCEKSVELNPSPPIFHLRLARAQIQCGFMEAAGDTLRHCLRHKATKGAAGFLMGLTYWKQGQRLRARQWFCKTISHEEAGSSWHKQAKSCITALQKT